ncbi:pilin [Candidatus Micrarchaeota archaeon]|nr:pilin [Candidatus Micrarchaeota archaeon]MBU1929898.1 pilin [Candidatus Micrarchaeota archaeon]
MNKKICLALIAFLLIAPFSLAQEIEQITEPLNKVYDLLKAIVGVAAVIALTIAGARFMFAGENTQSRDGAKTRH